MLRKYKHFFLFILCLFLTVYNLGACGVSDVDTGSESSVLDFFESLQDNDAVPYTLTQQAKVMLSENEDLFLNNSLEGLEAYTDFSLEYKILAKNIEKYGDKLMYLPEAYVVSIDETALDEDTTFSELHLMDASENSYYVLSFSAYSDIYEGDIVSAYALPLGETAFENIGGGTTLAIVLAGSYIEKVEF